MGLGQAEGVVLDRRTFLSTVTLGLLAAPLAAEAQQAGKVWRVGYLSLASGPSPRSEAFQQGLRELGYVVGQNITIEYRWAEGDLDRARVLAADLVRSNAEAIVTGGRAQMVYLGESR
jgi:putative ABC transport system substrate-binding protein